MLLLMLSQSVLADDKRRPSWSQGLPEKTSAPTRNLPKMDRPEVDDVQKTTLERPEMELETNFTSLSEVVISQPKNSSEPPKVTITDEKVATPINGEFAAAKDPKTKQTTSLDLVTASEIQSSTNNSVEKAAKPAVIKSLATPVSKSQILETLASENNNFSWQLTRQVPVAVSPVLLTQQDSVLLKLMINNEGRVVSIDRVLADTPEMLIAQAERSLKKWRFVSPSDEGIQDDLLQRVFKVSLSAR